MTQAFSWCVSGETIETWLYLLQGADAIVKLLPEHGYQQVLATQQDVYLSKGIIQLGNWAPFGCL